MTSKSTKTATRGTATSTKGTSNLSVSMDASMSKAAKQAADKTGQSYAEFVQDAVRERLEGITPAREFTLTKKQAKSIRRLAWQLDIAPAKLVSRFIDLQIRVTDWQLSENAEPLSDGCEGYFNCTAAMDAMSFEEIQSIEDASGEDCQRVLYKIDCAKRGFSI